MTIDFAFAFLAATALGLSGVAAADAPVRAEDSGWSATSCLSSLSSFLQSTSKDCPLQWNGFTLYGAIDLGAGHSSQGAAFNPVYPQGVQEVIARFSQGAKWQIVPNGLQRSNVGLATNWVIAPGWTLVGNLDTDFDPYSLRLANGPASLVENNAVPLGLQSANGDSSRAGQFDNTQGYFGVSNATFGSLTVGRLNSFSAEAVSTYDAMFGSYAFSLIGNSSTYVSGVGDTETARYESAIKYYWSGTGAHAGAIWQFGGLSLGNGSNAALQVDAGASLGNLSVDAVYSHAQDAVSLSLYGANPLPAGIGPNDLRATLANIDGGLIATKYDAGAMKFYGGYEYASFSPPSDPHSSGFTSLGGFRVLPGAVNSTTYLTNKRLQVGWVGARYALRPDFDLAAAYYLVRQNAYIPSTAKPSACGPNTVPAFPGASPQGSLNGFCAGGVQAYSGLVDFRPFNRVDLYAGFLYSIASGGMANGFIHSSNFAQTAGLRLSF